MHLQAAAVTQHGQQRELEAQARRVGKLAVHYHQSKPELVPCIHMQNYAP